MKTRYWRRGLLLAVFCAVALFSLLLNGCSGGSSSSGGGSGTLTVTMVDAPPGNTVTALNVTIDSLEANINGTWTAITTTPKSFNLLDLVKNETILGSASLPPGHYTQIRLFPSSATVTDATGTHPVTIPSGAQTGVKINVDYDIGSNQVTTILLDFNLNKSLVQQGNGGYLLQPVIPVVVKTLSGTISGTVTDGTNPLQGAVVTATYTAGPSYAAGTQVNTGTTLADGTFKVWALLPGTYTLNVSYTDANNNTKTGTKTGVVVVANQDSAVGTITVQ